MIKVITVDERLNLQGICYKEQSGRIYHRYSAGHGNSNDRADFKGL